MFFIHFHLFIEFMVNTLVHVPEFNDVNVTNQKRFNRQVIRLEPRYEIVTGSLRRPN